mgnify:FL=1
MPRRTLTGKVPKQRSNPYVEHNCFPLDGCESPPSPRPSVRPSRGGRSRGTQLTASLAAIRCFCDQFPRLKARLRTCQTNRNGNRGRKFWSCANPDEYWCVDRSPCHALQLL